MTRDASPINPSSPTTADHITNPYSAYCTQRTLCNLRGGVDATSTQPSTAEPGAVSNNDGECEIINGGAGDVGGVKESKGDESASVTSVVQQAHVDFVVPEGFKKITRP